MAVGSSDAAGQPGSFALARYTRNGSLDGSFGRGGKVLTCTGLFALIGPISTIIAIKGAPESLQ